MSAWPGHLIPPEVSRLRAGATVSWRSTVRQALGNARHDGRIGALILLNGPPGVGKSTLARRFVDDHPLSLLLQVDAIRSSLGQWQRIEETKVVARSLAAALAEIHLRAGHDVVVPQYLGRLPFIETLADIARRVGCPFHEVLLVEAEAAVVDRFHHRRAELASAGLAHPQADVDDGDIMREIADACERLRWVQAERPQTIVVDASGGLEDAYRSLCRALGA